MCSHECVHPETHTQVPLLECNVRHVMYHGGDTVHNSGSKASNDTLGLCESHSVLLCLCDCHEEEQKWETEMKLSTIQIWKVAHRCRTPPPGLWPSGPGASWTAGASRPRRTRRATGWTTRTRTPHRPGRGTGTTGSTSRKWRWTSSWRALEAREMKERETERVTVLIQSEVIQSSSNISNMFKLTSSP